MHKWIHCFSGISGHAATPLGNQAISTMTWYPTHSHYPDIEPTSPRPILIMPSGRHYIHICTSTHIYSKTSLHRPTKGPILSSPFREVVGLGSFKISWWVVVWDPDKAIDIGEWSICGGGRLERIYCKYIYIYSTTPDDPMSRAFVPRTKSHICRCVKLLVCQDHWL